MRPPDALIKSARLLLLDREPYLVVRDVDRSGRHTWQGDFCLVIRSTAAS